MNEERLFSVTIEETVSDSFDIISDSIENALKKAMKKCNDEDFVLTPGNIGCKQIMAYDQKNSFYSEWAIF